MSHKLKYQCLNEIACLAGLSSRFIERQHRSTRYKKYDAQDLERAMEAICHGNMKIVDAARMYGIPATTLSTRYAKYKTKNM